MATIRIPSWRYLGCLIPATGAFAFACFFVYSIVVSQHHLEWYREVDYRILRLCRETARGSQPETVGLLHSTGPGSSTAIAVATDTSIMRSETDSSRNSIDD